MVLACIVVQNVELYLLAGNKEVIGEKKQQSKHTKKDHHTLLLYSLPFHTMRCGRDYFPETKLQHMKSHTEHFNAFSLQGKQI